MLSFYRVRFMYHQNEQAEGRSAHNGLAVVTDETQL